MLVDVLDDALVHKENMWSARYIRVDRHWEDELICKSRLSLGPAWLAR